MAEKTKKEKGKFKDYDAAKEHLTATKEEKTVAVDEFKAFVKENKLSKEDEPEDEKLAKKWKKMKAAIKEKKAEIEETEAWMKENKPKKERKIRPTKYEYPEGMSSADKKKFRAAERAKAKKALKESEGGGKKKSDKKNAAKEEPVKLSKKAKKKAKAAKEEVAEGAED